MLRYNAEVLENHEIADSFYRLIIVADEIAHSADPGQFIHIRIPNDGSLLLRRPISINGIDQERGRVQLVYQVVGKGTKILSNVKIGTKLDVLGPLGRGFWIPQGTQKICIVGGGCGVAPTRFIGQKWGHLEIYSFLGFRNKDMVFQVEDFERFSKKVFLSTDDGSMGYKGSVIQLLQQHLLSERPNLILACGPIPMLIAMQSVVGKYNIPCQISLEERMGCGVGGCMVCSCAIGDSHQKSYKKVCSDGPVFWSKEVFLDGKLKTGC